MSTNTDTKKKKNANGRTPLESARERSRLVRFGGRCVRRVRAAAAQSRIVAIVPDGVPTGSNSSTGSSSDGPTEFESDGSLARVRRGSSLWRRLESVGAWSTGTTAAALERARLAAVGDAIRRYVTASWGYRWLTTEPEPDVIVIDLRETRSVGPVIAVVDQVIDRLAATAPASSVGRGLESLAAFVRTRPIRATSLVVLPTILVSLLALVLTATATITLPLLAVHLGLGLLAGMGVRSRRSLEEVRESRVVRVLAAAFEPPEPPESASRWGSESKPESESKPGPTRASPTRTDRDDDERYDDRSLE